MTKCKSAISSVKVICLCMAMFCAGVHTSLAQDPFPELAPIYKDDVVARVDIVLPPDSLDIILAPGNEESDYHFHATFMFDNGSTRDTIENVGFRLRGNTSRFSQKKSFKVSFNTYESGRKWYGVEKLNLNGEHNDPSVSRTKICWDLIRDIGIPAPRANHVQLYINGDYYGVYANVEHIDEEFAGTRFGNKDGNLYKCLWPADLDYLGSDPDLYKLMNGDRRVYELKTNEDVDDYSDLAHFIDILNNTSINHLRCELEAVFNVNSYLLSIAFDILSGNWDGPLYNKNNFYLYHNEATGLFDYIPYDLDNTFGIDWFGVDWSHRDIYSWGNPNEPRPLYWRIMQVQEYRDRFSFYMNRIIEEVYYEDALFAKIEAMRTLIGPLVDDDPYYPLDYGFSQQDFDKSFEEALPYNFTPIGIKPFITNRINATLDQLELNDISPIISDISSNNPSASQEIAIQTFVEDDNEVAIVKVIYQLNGVGAVFTEEMYDDGMHDDKESGDGWYGAFIPPLGTSATLGYFIQAKDQNENSDRAPVCGWLKLAIGSSSVSLAVNEFMASNDTTIADEAGEFDDWVEIYNFGSEAIYLGDRYLSDKSDEPTQWQFPDIWIQANEYILVWCDKDEEQGDMHSNFKLSADGDFIGIFDNDDNLNILIDGLEFGPQVTDQAVGRLPDGTGEFPALIATPGSANDIASSIKELVATTVHYRIYPNPTRDILFVESDQVLAGHTELIVMDPLGRIVMKEDWRDRMMLNMGHLPNGLYFIAISEGGRLHSAGRVIKQ